MTAAEQRVPVEPVCPEGVTAWASSTKGVLISTSPDQSALVHVLENGALVCLWTYDRAQREPAPALLRYAADLSEYRAALHAASDHQRKLDAVKAAEAAAKKAAQAAIDALGVRDDALRVLSAARREAGL